MRREATLGETLQGPGLACNSSSFRAGREAGIRGLDGALGEGLAERRGAARRLYHQTPVMRWVSEPFAGRTNRRLKGRRPCCMAAEHWKAWSMSN